MTRRRMLEIWDRLYGRPVLDVWTDISGINGQSVADVFVDDATPSECVDNHNDVCGTTATTKAGLPCQAWWESGGWHSKARSYDNCGSGRPEPRTARPSAPRARKTTTPDWLGIPIVIDPTLPDGVVKLVGPHGEITGRFDPTPTRSTTGSKP